jgi:hypothetical protein
MTRKLGDVPSLDDYLRPFGLFLARRGFVQFEAREDPEHFGDALQSYANNDFRIRFARDRWVFYIDVASAAKPQDWLPLPAVLKFLSQDHRNSTEPPWPSDAHQVVTLLESHYDALSTFLGVEGFRERRESLQDFARREALRRLASPRP